MSKFSAITCVVGWSAFWVFGYLALTAAPGESAQMMVNAFLAAAGFFAGMVSWLRIARMPSRLAS